MTALLDIDHVVLTWDDRHTTPYNGFNDYINPNVKWFSRYSPEQLQLIHDSFDEVIWHTTWSKQNLSNQHFCPTTGFAPRENLIDRFGGAVRHLPPDVTAACQRVNWFKLDAVALWLEAGHGERFIWIDDDLRHTWNHGVKRVLDCYGATEQCLAIAPTDGWTRRSILAAAEWLQGDEPGRYVTDHAYKG